MSSLQDLWKPDSRTIANNDQPSLDHRSTAKGRYEEMRKDYSRTVAALGSSEDRKQICKSLEAIIKECDALIVDVNSSTIIKELKTVIYFCRKHLIDVGLQLESDNNQYALSLFDNALSNLALMQELDLRDLCMLQSIHNLADRLGDEWSRDQFMRRFSPNMARSSFLFPSRTKAEVHIVDLNKVWQCHSEELYSFELKHFGPEKGLRFLTYLLTELEKLFTSRNILTKQLLSCVIKFAVDGTTQSVEEVVVDESSLEENDARDMRSGRKDGTFLSKKSEEAAEEIIDGLQEFFATYGGEEQESMNTFLFEFLLPEDLLFNGMPRHEPEACSWLDIPLDWDESLSLLQDCSEPIEWSRKLLIMLQHLISVANTVQSSTFQTSALTYTLVQRGVLYCWRNIALSCDYCLKECGLTFNERLFLAEISMDYIYHSIDQSTEIAVDCLQNVLVGWDLESLLEKSALEQLNTEEEILFIRQCWFTLHLFTWKGLCFGSFLSFDVTQIWRVFYPRIIRSISHRRIFLPHLSSDWNVIDMVSLDLFSRRNGLDMEEDMAIEDGLAVDVESCTERWMNALLYTSAGTNISQDGLKMLFPFRILENCDKKSWCQQFHAILNFLFVEPGKSFDVHSNGIVRILRLLLAEADAAVQNLVDMQMAQELHYILIRVCAITLHGGLQEEGLHAFRHLEDISNAFGFSSYAFLPLFNFSIREFVLTDLSEGDDVIDVNGDILRRLFSDFRRLLGSETSKSIAVSSVIVVIRACCSRFRFAPSDSKCSLNAFYIVLCLCELLKDNDIEVQLATVEMVHRIALSVCLYTVNELKAVADYVVQHLLPLLPTLTQRLCRRCLTVLGEIYYLLYRCPLVIPVSQSPAFPVPLCTITSFDDSTASDLYEFCSFCCEIDVFVRQDLRKVYLWLTQLPQLNSFNPAVAHLHKTLTNYFYSDGDWALSKSDVITQLQAVSADIPDGVRLRLWKVFGEMVNLGLRKTTNNESESSPLVLYLNTNPLLSVLRSLKAAEFCEYQLAQFATKDVLIFPLHSSSWQVLFSYASAAIAELSDILHSKVLYKETFYFFEEAAFSSSQSSKPHFDEDTDAYQQWLPLSPECLERFVLPWVDKAFAYLVEHKRSLERWRKVSFADHTFQCSQSANGSDDDSDDLSSLNDNKITFVRDQDQYLKTLLVLHRVKFLFILALRNIFMVMNRLHQLNMVEDGKWERILESFIITMKVFCKDLPDSSGLKLSIRRLMLSICEQNQYWNKSVFSLITAAKLSYQLDQSWDKVLQLCNEALLLSSPRQSGLSKSEKTATLYSISALRLKMALRCLVDPKYVDCYLFVHPEQSNQVDFTNSEGKPVAALERENMLWKVLMLAIAGLDECRKREAFHHKSVYRLAIFIYELSLRNIKPPESLCGEQGSSLISKRILPNVPWSSLSYETALDALKQLFDKKRQQIVAIWIMDNPISAWDQIMARVGAFDYLRRKYLSRFVDLLEICSAFDNAYQLLFHVIEAKGQSATVCLSLCLSLQTVFQIADKLMRQWDQQQNVKMNEIVGVIGRVLQLHGVLVRKQLVDHHAQVVVQFLKTFLHITGYVIEAPSLLEAIPQSIVLHHWNMFVDRLKKTELASNESKGCKRKRVDSERKTL